MPYVTSTKSLTGHSLGATGVQETIYTILMMNNNFISPSINIDDPDQSIGKISIPQNAINDYDIKFGLTNSFGFGNLAMAETGDILMHLGTEKSSSSS